MSPQPVAPDAGSDFYKPLSASPTPEDILLHRDICDHKLVTERLHQLVPLLQFIGCEVERMGVDVTTLSAPLIDQAMNQNGTHQAAVFYLIADYTLGVAMCGVLPGVYVTGVHDRCRALPVQYWLKRGSIQHLAPGTGRLRAEVKISPEKATELRGQLIAKRRAEITETVLIYQGGQLVATAEHTMRIYVDAPRVGGARANIFQVQNMKTSALMIAGLRDDPISKVVAGEQGRAIATRMALASPQLYSLVKARSLHLEAYLKGHGRDKVQVVALGVGLDVKPIVYSSSSQHWFGIDLRDMLEERALRFAAASLQSERFSPVVADIRLEGWDAKLRDAGFLANVPTLIICEGLSMYFPADEFRDILSKALAFCAHPHSRIWIDHVSSRFFRLEALEVKAFLSTMARLGEPFVSGFDTPGAIGSHEWRVTETASASKVLGLSDPIYDEYIFSILAPAAIEGN